VLLNREHFTDWFDFSGPEQSLDFFFVVDKLLLEVEVDPGLIWLQRVVFIFVLDPCIIHEGLFEKLLELTGILDYFGFRAGVIDGEGDLETSFTLTLPTVLSVLLILHMVEWTKPSKSYELLACGGLNFLVDWRKEVLNFGTPLANYEASKTEFVDVFFGHVQFVDQLSSVW